MGKVKSINLKYWACQILGWGAWILFVIYINMVVYKEIFKSQFPRTEQYDTAVTKFIASVILNFIVYILITHILRLILKKLDWLRYPFNGVLLIFIFGAIGSGVASYFVTDKLEKVFNISTFEYRKEVRLDSAKSIEKLHKLDSVAYYKPDFKSTRLTDSVKTKIQIDTRWEKDKKGHWQYKEPSTLLGIYQSIILTALWLLIYLVWHYIERNRKTQLANLRLEAVVKELELKTIKAHVNPHFIFNSLNSIRALVDENPQRARTAITELSNLLRSSMQAEKNEMVTLEKELQIVEDYLALEKIRFEERLQVEMQIDDDTYDQLVPPMVIQTLVENAIKHGISKSINGGLVKVKSDFVDSHYELVVENTGLLEGGSSNDGFGIKSTIDRLKLLYGANTDFAIKQKDKNTVSVTVKLPIKLK